MLRLRAARGCGVGWAWVAWGSRGLRVPRRVGCEGRVADFHIGLRAPSTGSGCCCERRRPDPAVVASAVDRIGLWSRAPSTGSDCCCERLLPDRTVVASAVDRIGLLSRAPSTGSDCCRDRRLLDPTALTRLQEPRPPRAAILPSHSPHQRACVTRGDRFPTAPSHAVLRYAVNDWNRSPRVGERARRRRASGATA
jgi:hypothetical protein